MYNDWHTYEWFFKSTFSWSIHYSYPPSIPLTNQGKVKTWLLLSAMAIVRSVMAVKMTPKKSSFIKINNIDLPQHAVSRRIAKFFSLLLEEQGK